MVDRTYNVTLNLPEDCTEQVKALLDWIGLEVGVVIVSADGLDGGETDGSAKGRKGTIHKGN